MIYDIDGVSLVNAYNKSGSLLNETYDINGNRVFSRKYQNPTYTYLKDISISNTQGFDIYNGTLFQFRAGSGISNKMTTANFSTGAIISSNVTITSDHGDSATFSTEKYDEADDFPLLYVSADTSPYIYVNRVTSSSATLVKTFYLAYNVAGYHAVGTFDWANNIMYTIGTVKDDYQSDQGGTNPCIVCKWDLTDLTDNGNGTYTPKLISTYQRPFIYVMQGEQYHDGYIWIGSGYGTGTEYIYAMNPDTGEFAYTLTMPITTEIEGMSWQVENGVYYMIVGFQGGKYYRVDFS